MYFVSNDKNKAVQSISIVVYIAFDIISYFTVDLKIYNAAKYTFYVFMICYNMVDGDGWGIYVM